MPNFASSGRDPAGPNWLTRFDGLVEILLGLWRRALMFRFRHTSWWEASMGVGGDDGVHRRNSGKGKELTGT